MTQAGDFPTRSHGTESTPHGGGMVPCAAAQPAHRRGMGRGRGGPGLLVLGSSLLLLLPMECSAFAPSALSSAGRLPRGGMVLPRIVSPAGPRMQMFPSRPGQERFSSPADTGAGLEEGDPGALYSLSMGADSRAMHVPRGGDGAGYRASMTARRVLGTGIGIRQEGDDQWLPPRERSTEGSVADLVDAGVVPDLWDKEFADAATLSVIYPKWVRSAVDLRNPFSFGDTPTRGAGRIERGATITPTQSQDPPRVSFAGDADALYTLVLTDPDVPSRRNPIKREFVHWVRCNIPGGEVERGGEEEMGGEDVYQYVGAGPPPNTGLHRYVFLLFRQDGRVEVPATQRVGMTGVGRPGFSTRRFAEEHGLGEPVGWSMFEAEYDSYCDALYATLRGK
eukprot:CAMPEP_0172053616 /NCGR_PEP_ID=MMETSP1043-20130122/4310_1 /TAXON_ID=464988 /ORGANISM="Hemiselmis andersenii, Strain CCMP441" /LENGTH=393 /DNA_ID=CAMNT_0012712895 /DNA_START=47 /DNA_END=1231 /DNA_ORIENTATION=+